MNTAPFRALPAALAALAISFWTSPQLKGADAGVETTDQPTRELRLPLPGGTPVRFVWVPPGRFLMGAPAHEPDRETDEQQHTVTLTRGFWLGRFEVSNRAFRAFRPGHRSWGMQGEKGEFNGDDQPVVCVDASAAAAFCRWAAAATGRPIRLPTQAEWEYACRAGSKNAYCFGDDRRLLGDYAWIAANSGGHTHPVGQKKPNVLGLHDMHGNVAEWVNDLYTYYPGGPQTDPKGPAQSKSHAWRECSWSSQPFECRCATRGYSAPGYQSAALGLRVACDAEPGRDHETRPGSTRPNILVAISDDQSFLHTSAAGFKAVRTPAFDRVAREGILFRNAFAASPGTLETLVKQQKKYPFLLDDADQWTVRKDVYYYDAPNAKFVLATGCGNPGRTSFGLQIAEAQLAIADAKKHPEVAGNVKAVDSRDLWREANVSPKDQGHHYNRNAETYLEVGLRLGWAMADLLNHNQ